jgi:hypothetical protein
MGKVTAKLMREAKEARKMGDGGVGGNEGISLTESTPDLTVGVLPGEESDFANTAYSAAAPTIGEGPETTVPVEGMPPGTMYGSQMPGEIFGTPTGQETPGAPGHEPQPRKWEEKVETPKGEEKTPTPAITRKKRRRSLLTPEEGGILGTTPVYRRSILGR